MRIFKSPVQRMFDVLIYFMLALFTFTCIAPVIHVIVASFSDPIMLEKNMGLLLWPLGFTLKGYQLVFTMPVIPSGYMNTIFVVVCGTILNVALNCIAAYVLMQKDWWLTKPITFLIMLTMFFSGGMIPTFLLVKDLGLIDNRLALILPSAISVWNVIVMRTSFMAIPESLNESARIDGANDMHILFRITIPLSMAVISVISLFYAVGHWNAWFDAMIYLRDRTKYPLQVVLREMLIVESTTVSASQGAKVLNSDTLSIYKKLIKYTAIVISTVPVLCFYPFVQKYFVKGVMIGSVKG